MTARPAHRCQLLTPPGAGAIAIVRITGPDPARLVDKLLQPAAQPSLSDTIASRLRYGRIVQSGEVIDDVVVYRIEHNESAAVEICCHGGIRVVERILDALAGVGAILKTADEERTTWVAATRVAREALELLPHARTHGAVKFLAWQRENTPRWLEETAGYCTSDPGEARTRIEALLARADTAQRIIHGATVVLIGPPNSGKSTLFNRLVGRDAAIVSSAEGTTRDWVGASIELRGISVTLIDTAGRRPSPCDLERIAIETGVRASTTADLSLVIADSSNPICPQIEGLLAEQSPSRSILVLNKCDIPGVPHVTNTVDTVASTIQTTVCVSARDGTGISDLTEVMIAQLCRGGKTHSQPAAFTTRQVQTWKRVLELLARDAPAAEILIQHELIGNGR